MTRRLLWLCRDPQPPRGGETLKRRPAHKLFTGKPQLIDVLADGRPLFCATRRVAFVGELHLPLRATIAGKTFQALQPGEGRWIRIVLE